MLTCKTFNVIDLVLKAVRTYNQFLHAYPLVVKSLTSAVIASLSNLTSQLIRTNHLKLSSETSSNGLPTSNGRNHHPSSVLNYVHFRSVASFFAYGLLVTGPFAHKAYGALEKIFPQTEDFYQIKRLLLERLVFTPVLCLETVISLELFQKGSLLSPKECSSRFIQTLLGHWKVWTLPQLINVSIVPVQFRFLFASFVAFLWNIYLANANSSNAASDYKEK